MNITNDWATLWNPGAESYAKKVGLLRFNCYIHRYSYYVKNEPIITDREYDQLERDLSFLINQNLLSQHPLCPTVCLGSDRREDYPEIIKIFFE